MSELPVYIPPKTDELLISWIDRLADANCLTQREFMSFFVFNGNGRKTNYLVLDCQIDISGFIPWIKQQISVEDVILKHTEYPAVAPFISAQRQSQMLLAAFGAPFTKSLNHKSITIRTCQACQETDPYIRRSHCLPGVKACWLHGTSLTGEEISEADIKYARYVHDWLEAMPDFDVTTMRKSLSLVNMDEYCDFEKNIQKMMVSYPDVSMIKPVALISVDLPEEYSVLYHSNTFNTVLHSCGTVFGMNAAGLKAGWLCPSCQKKLSDEERFQNYIMSARNGSYRMITPFNSRSVTLEHTCGRRLTCKPSKFLLGKKCACEAEKGSEARHRRLDQIGHGEFEEINYADGAVTLRHKTCGNTFTINWMKFIKRPWCRFCNPGQKRTEESVADEIKCINPEFEYISGFSRSSSFFKVRHIPCGSVKTTRMYEFKHDCTCAKCRKDNNKTEELNENKNSYQYITVYKALQNRYSADEIIFLDDVCRVTGLSPRLAKIAMKSIENNSLMEHVQNALGAYCFPGRSFEPDEIIRQKYIDRHGEIIGFFYGTSFGYQIGVCRNAGTPSIATVIEAAPDARLTTYCSQKVRLKTVPTGLTQDNWQVCQLADFICSGYRFYSQTEENWNLICDYAVAQSIEMESVIALCKGKKLARSFIKWYQQKERNEKNGTEISK